MEVPPLRHVLVVGVVLSLFIFLVATAPAELMTDSTEYRQYEYPDEFGHIDLTMYASTVNFTLGDSSGSSQWDTFGHTCSLVWAGGVYDEIYNTHFYGFLNLASDLMEWKNNQGVSRGDFLSVSEMSTDFSSSDNVARYVVTSEGDPSWSMDAFVVYNTTIYNTLTDAWNNDALYLLFAAEFDELGTNWNAWTFIRDFMFFQTPNIHAAVNVVIAVPLWITFGWLAFAFIKAVIDALPFT